MDFRRRYDKLTDDINRVLTRAKSTSNVLGFKRSQCDSNYCKSPYETRLKLKITHK